MTSDAWRKADETAGETVVVGGDDGFGDGGLLLTGLLLRLAAGWLHGSVPF